MHEDDSLPYFMREPEPENPDSEEPDYESPIQRRSSQWYPGSGHVDPTEAELAPIMAGNQLSPRQKELARLLFLGKSNNEIASRLKYHFSRVSILRHNPRIIAEVNRLQELSFERTVSERLADLGPIALNRIEEALTSDEMRLRDVISLSQWVVEKLDGKPGQKVDIQSSTLEKFMGAVNELRDTQQAQPKSRGVIEIAAKPEQESNPESETTQSPDKWDSWFDSNI